LTEHIKENYSIELTTKQFGDLDTFDFDGTTTEVQIAQRENKKILDL